MQGDERPVNERFFNPGNVGDARQPNFSGQSASFQCGATVRVSLHIDDSQRIVEAKFRAAGCSVLVASASLLMDRILGQTTGEAAAVDELAGKFAPQFSWVSSSRNDCAALAREALVAAIREYSDAMRDSWEGEQVLICTCFGVSEQRIEQEIHDKRLATVAEVTRACNAGAGCRSCYPLIEDILDDYLRSNNVVP